MKITSNNYNNIYSGSTKKNNKDSLISDNKSAITLNSLKTLVKNNIEKLHEMGFKGKNVNIAIIDSGIYPHPDFKDRIKFTKDFSASKKITDEIGHGTHVAGIIAGNGKISDGKITGTAPEANIFAFKASNQNEAIKAVKWIIDNNDKYNIKVINMSLGVTQSKPFKQDAWAKLTDLAWKKGIFVTVAAGNDGPNKHTITSPGTVKSVITVANLDDKGTPNADDDSISESSSRGPTKYDKINKPDISAPGTDITAALAPKSDFAFDPSIEKIDSNKDKKPDYVKISGTSMASPFIAGIAADMIQAFPNVTNDQIKEAMMNTAVNIPNIPYYIQGKGIIDAYNTYLYLKNILEKKSV
jgi:serine protease AprX